MASDLEKIAQKIAEAARQGVQVERNVAPEARGRTEAEAGRAFAVSPQTRTLDAAAAEFLRG